MKFKKMSTQLLKKMVMVGIISTMGVSLVACSSNSQSSDATTTQQADDKKASENDTMIVGSYELNGVFNPLFYTTAPDAYAFNPVFSQVSELNDNNEIIDDAGNISFEEIKSDDGKISQVKYTIKLKEGLTFSDGKPVTIDDLIFGYHVLADPSYDGLNTFSSLNIAGLNEYYYDSPDYKTKMKEFEEEAKILSDADINEFLEVYTTKQIEEETAKSLNEELALELDENSSTFADDVKTKMLEINKADTSLIDVAKEAKYEKLKKEYIQANLADGIDVTSISGIEKVDDLTCTVLLNGANITAESTLGLSQILPSYYYGVAEDGTKFTKGDMTVPKSRNNIPLGSGPYKFVSYENNIVHLDANEGYFKGVPKTQNLKFQVVSLNNAVDVVANGEMDTTSPTAQKETIEKLKAEGIDYNLTDNNGYGYIGLNAERITDINIRKGLMSLMNRKPAIQSYYGDLAEVIERPLTTTLAEYPKETTAYYEYDVEKAKEYFAKAGYTNKDGKLVNKNGKQLKIEVGVGSLANHPTAGIFSQMKTDMDTLGAEFIVSDLPFNVLVDRINSDDLDMFSLAWGAANNADLTQIYHSKSAEGSGSNYFNLRDKELDVIIEEIAVTLDLDERSKLVSQALDLIMENAVIMPVYQRKNLDIFNKDTLKMDTVYRTESPYHTFRQEYYKIEMQ